MLALEQFIETLCLEEAFLSLTLAVLTQKGPSGPCPPTRPSCFCPVGSAEASPGAEDFRGHSWPLLHSAVPSPELVVACPQQTLPPKGHLLSEPRPKDRSARAPECLLRLRVCNAYRRPDRQTLPGNAEC